MTPIRFVLVLLLASALLVGCGAEEETAEPDPAPPATEPQEPATEPQEPGEPTGEMQACTNREQGYTVEYPADWHTNEPDHPSPACRYFDEEPIDVPEATEFFGAAITISREPVAAEELLEGGDPGREVLSREEFEVDGRRAFRVESESTGEGLLDAGVRFYEVIVVANGESVILTTYDFDEHDYDANREVLDRMAETLRLDDAA